MTVLEHSKENVLNLCLKLQGFLNSTWNCNTSTSLIMLKKNVKQKNSKKTDRHKTLQFYCIKCVFVLFNIILKIRNHNLLATILFKKYLRGCLHLKFHPKMKSSYSMVKYPLLFTHFCQDELIPVKKAGMKKRKNYV